MGTWGDLTWIFDEFHLTENSELFIYSSDKSMYLGSFNSKNNNPTGTLETAVVKGDNIIMSAFGAGFTWGATYLKWSID